MIEILTNAEPSMRSNDMIGDVLGKWEESNSDVKFIFKKKVFLNPTETPDDPVAAELLFYQVDVIP